MKTKMFTKAARWGTCCLIIASFAGASAARGETPGRGLTGAFEIAYLKNAIDHHFAALRISELAAGTDTTRNGQISSNEGTSPTPGFGSTPAKATLDDIKSMARQANRVQREEILRAQNFLRDWYGINYQPHISEVNRARIQILEEASAGDQFNHLYLEVFARHHFTISVRSLEAVTSSEIKHEALRRYAGGILEAQQGEINEMREMLCKEFNICDYQPYVGIKGRHTGDHGEIDSRYDRFNNLTSDEDEDNEEHTR
jgi:uncharacterized protein (DUF305 family)